ncbi:MAG: sulfite exporter TauE/SafE family protein [Pseudomonadota bacterium]|nr:sulfite exporter TauE/SafE family protein [Pseudomonadota bacterium]
MQNLILLVIAGIIAQLVDGSLGMAFGVTSTTLLLMVGVAPVLASTSVHLAEVGTTLASGFSHWRFGNVEWSMILWIGIPGGIGAFVGAVLLGSLSAEAAAPVVAIILFGLGVYILARFAFSRAKKVVDTSPIPKGFLAPLGLIAGTIDALGGGGWGPIGTSTLLASGRMEPRKVVGTVDTSEFIVAMCASIGFLLGLSLAEIPFKVVGALLIGGVIAAPIAAWIVRHLDARILGTAVGGWIILTNANTFLKALGFNEAINIPVYAAAIILWITALYFPISAARAERQRVLPGSAISEG